MSKSFFLPPRRHPLSVVPLAAVMALLLSGIGKAQLIESGSLTLTMDQGTAYSIDQFNAYFGPDATRSQTLSDPAPGTAPFTINSQNQVVLTDYIRAAGVVPSPYPGSPGATRSPQETTLNANLTSASSILGSFGSSIDEGPFVALTSSTKQIAFTGMQRWVSSAFTGSLLYGDFGLRYTSDRAGTTAAVSGDTLSGLVLTSNIDFLNASWADLGNVKITTDATGFQITGDLLVSQGLTVLDPTAVTGSVFGTFDLNASTVAVPEPSSMGLTLLGVGAMALMGWRGKRKRSGSNI
jgi:hypothetical protein